MSLKDGIREMRQADEPVFAELPLLLESFAASDATAAKPDLSIKSFGISASTFSAGDHISLSGAVANIGSTSAGAFSTRAFLSTDTVIGGSDAVLWTYTTTSLNPTDLANFASTATLPSNLSPGTYYVGVWTDYLGQVTESNENNNATSIAITIKGASQSTSYSLTPPSTTVAEGAGTLTFTVTRSGGLPAETVYASTLFDTATSASDDYDPLVNKAISFAANQTTQSFTVHVNQDSVVESTEHFRVMIGATTGAGSAQALDISDIYITDDDAPPPNTAPVVTGTATVNLTVGQTVAASTLFTSATDADGAVAKIRFWDSTHETGYFVYDGQKVTAGYVDVTPAQLSKLNYVTGSTAGKNDIVIEAFDNLGLDSNDLAVRINIVAAPPSSTGDTVREGTDTQNALQQGQALIGKIDAEPIAGDGVTSDRQGGLVDKDWYSVTLERGHLYTFSGSSVSLGTGKVALSLYDANGVAAQSAVEGSSPSFSFDTSGQSAASQTYYVAVSAGGAEPAWRTATGNYSIKYVDKGVPEAAPDDWADDPHDAGSPGALTAGGNLAGTIERIGDYDYFTVYLTAGKTYHLSVAGETRSGIGKIDTAALSLRSSSDFDTRLQSDGGFGGAGFDYDIKQSGTYYVRVGAGSDASDIGGYRVSVGTGRVTPVPISSPAPTPGSPPPDQSLNNWLSEHFYKGTSFVFDFQGSVWSYAGDLLKEMDSSAAIRTAKYMEGAYFALGIVVDTTSAGDKILHAAAEDRQKVIFVELTTLMAGLGVAAGATVFMGPGAGFVAGMVWTFYGEKVFHDFASSFYDLTGGISSSQRDDVYSEYLQGLLFQSGEDGQQDIVTFDENYYLSNHPDVALQIADGQFGSAYAHFLSVGIDQGHQPNSTQTLSRSDLAISLLNNDPQAIGNSALFTLGLGELAGDGVGSGEGAVATAVASAAGVAHGAALDAELSAIAHRKALDLAVNASFDPLAGAHATNSSWALQWSNGSDFRQAFAGDFEDLLGPNAPDAAYRLFVVSSSSGTPTDVLTKLQAQQGWSGSGFDTLGIAEYGGLWVVIVADRADGVAAVAPDADTLSQVSIYGTAQGESLYAGLRSGRLFGMDGDDTLIGGGGSDTLDGGAGDDVIYAGLGNDIIEGGAGRDLSYGQGGADTFVFKPGDSLYATYDVIYDFEAGVDRIDLTALYKPTLLLATVLSGTSTFLFADADADGTWEFALQLENARITGDDIVLPAALGPIGLIAYGTTGDDQLVGGAGGDVLVGDIGTDRLTGGAGKDALNGGAGNDWLDGGSGSDVAIYAVSRSQATVTRDAVAHTLIVNAGTEGTDTLIRTEQVQFSDGLYSFNFADAGAPVVANFAVGAGGWSSQMLYPRHVADVNGDGFGDIVGFGQAGVLVSYGSASGTFSNAALVVDNFGQSAGWTSDDLFHRELADVNGDGRADIIGFGQAGTLVSLARADGTFGAPTFAIGDFGTAQGWSTQDSFARTTGDVNGDGRADIIGFGQAGTLVALGNGDGTFQATRFAANNFGVAQGWSSDTSFHRSVADVNGDGKADLIGFGAAGTYVALSNGDGTFQDATLALTNFGTNQGWTSNDLYARVVADINHDGVADIIGFGQAGTLVAYGNGDGTFSSASFDLANFGQAQGWSSDASYHREIADINHDGLADIVGFGYAGVLVGANHGDFLDHGGFADIVTPGQADTASDDGTGDTTFTDPNSDLANVFLAPDQSSGTNNPLDFAAFNHDSLVDTVGLNYASGPTPLHQVEFLA